MYKRWSPSLERDAERFLQERTGRYLMMTASTFGQVIPINAKPGIIPLKSLAVKADRNRVKSSKMLHLGKSNTLFSWFNAKEFARCYGLK